VLTCLNKGAVTLSITTISIVTLSLMDIIATLNTFYAEFNFYCYTECLYAVIMLVVGVLNVVALSVVMLKAIMQSVDTLSVIM
jgi:hypothetical protein